MSNPMKKYRFVVPWLVMNIFLGHQNKPHQILIAQCFLYAAQNSAMAKSLCLMINLQ
jgi:hypothetical protein